MCREQVQSTGAFHQAPLQSRSTAETRLASIRKRAEVIEEFKVRSLLVTFVFLCLICVGSSIGNPKHAYSSQELNWQAGGPFAGRTDPERRNVLEKVDMIYFHIVKDGKERTGFVTREDLKSGGPLSFDGYVCGIVVFCDEDMAVSVEGRKMSKIRRNTDGTFSVKYYGKLRPEELGKTYYEKLASRNGSSQKEGKFLLGGYSLFPEITGDAVHPKDRFRITLGSRGRSVELPVEQDGYKTICVVPANPDSRTLDVAVRYIGTNAQGMQNDLSDFPSRVNAIAEGIASVEYTFQTDLVNSVNIIDYAGIQNAVTRDEGNDIWIYSETFRNEPVDELRSIAAHESLHKLVANQRLSRSSEVCTLFCDLKGFDILSYERFILMTTGAVPPERPASSSENELFFSFINEKHFIEGMKGGHSQANPDELCVSLLHSLMFIDRLKGNLDRPIALPDSDHYRFLTDAEKALVVDKYIKSIQVLLGSVPEEKNNRDAQSCEQTRSLLLTALDQVRSVKENRQLAMTTQQ